MSNPEREEPMQFPNFLDFSEDFSTARDMAIEKLHEAILLAYIESKATNISDPIVQDEIGMLCRKKMIQEWDAIEGLPGIGDSVTANGLFLFGVLPSKNRVGDETEFYGIDQQSMLHGTVYGITVTPYFDQEILFADPNIENASSTFYRPFGLNLILEDAYRLDADGELTFYDTQHVQLTLQHNFDSLKTTRTA